MLCQNREENMIEYVSGDFFDYNADIRINTVNCVGVMGAGVALEFKNKYPDMFKAYVKVCNEKKIEPGNPYIWEEQDLFSKCVIINLPTKIHWKNPSKYEYVKKDLEWLRQYLKCKDKNCVVTLPALGCGHGGLNWSIIRNEIEYYLGDMQAKILVFEPSSSNMKLSNFNYEIRKQDDIKIIRKEDEKYLYVADIDNELYCRGNIDLLELKKLSIICGNSILNREKNATLSILEEMKTDNCAIVLGINNVQHLEFAKLLLECGNKLILIISYGITKFKYYKELEQYLDCLLVLSYVKPDQEPKQYEYYNSCEYRCKISDAILYIGEDYVDIKKNINYLKKCDNLYYINYWTQSISEFQSINAKKIGISPHTKKPIITSIEQCINK